MSLASILRTPPPPHAFLLGGERLAYGRLTRNRAALERVEGEALAPAWFELGPVGVLQVERTVLAAALQRVLGRLDRLPAKAALVVPNSWVRSVVVDVGALPRSRDEAEETVRWRLKKLLPCRPDEVRIDYLSVDGNGRALVMLGLDRPFTVLEETFAAARVQLVRVEPVALAVAPLVPANSPAAVVLAVEARALGVVVIAGGRVRWVRQKALPEGTDKASVFLLRELGRTMGLIHEVLGPSDDLPLWLAVESDALAATVAGWAQAEGRVAVRRLQVQGPPGAGALECLALLGTAWGGA